MARVTGSRGTNWGLVVVIILLLIVLAALAFAFIAPDQASQIVPGLQISR